MATDQLGLIAAHKESFILLRPSRIFLNFPEREHWNQRLKLQEWIANLIKDGVHKSLVSKKQDPDGLGAWVKRQHVPALVSCGTTRQVRGIADADFLHHFWVYVQMNFFCWHQIMHSLFFWVGPYRGYPSSVQQTFCITWALLSQLLRFKRFMWTQYGWPTNDLYNRVTHSLPGRKKYNVHNGLELLILSEKIIIIIYIISTIGTLNPKG